MIRVTVVHGNDDVVELEFATYNAAVVGVTLHENDRHGTEGKPLSSFFDWIAEDRSQFGTDYHYVMFAPD